MVGIKGGRNIVSIVKPIIISARFPSPASPKGNSKNGDREVRQPDGKHAGGGTVVKNGK